MAKAVGTAYTSVINSIEEGIASTLLGRDKGSSTATWLRIPQVLVAIPLLNLTSILKGIYNGWSN